MLSVLRLAALAAILLTAIPSAAGHERRAAVTVMTRNLYFGTDLGPVLAATEPRPWWRR